MGTWPYLKRLRTVTDTYTNEGQVPIIRAPKGNAAEMIAKKLETNIRDAILTASRAHGPSLFAQDSTGLSNLSRPRTPSYDPF